MTATVISSAAPETGRLSFADIPGWAADDLDAALNAQRAGDGRVPWDGGRAWFEATYRPGREIMGQFTGYFEPELDASPVRTDAFPCPIHALPGGGITLPRARIDPALAGHEIAWLRDPVDRFFLQVQGSGRLNFTDGGVMRVGYAGTNGHAYFSIGKRLVERGLLGPDITAEDLKAWLRADLPRGIAVMNENPSYVLFRTVDAGPDIGPMGTFCPVTALRSLAVDPAHTPLGTPVWIEVAGHARLCIAQDTGSAIKGPGRADLFHGTGTSAGRVAGELNHSGRFVPLVRR